MNIVITVSSIASGGGLSKYVYTLANMLADVGHSVSVVTTHSSSDENNQSICYLSSNVSVYSSADNFILRRYWKTYKLIRALKPHVIINNYNGVVQYLLPLVKRGTKVIHVLHNDTVDFYRIANINARLVDAWIAPTRAIADHFNAFTKAKSVNRTHVIAHGVEKCNCEVKKSITPPELTFVGVLYEHKGAHLLPEIIKSLIKNGVNFHFNVVGDGVLRNAIEEKLKAEVADGIVQFWGRIAPSEVYPILARSSVFVYPTQLDAFGLVIAEAMMCGAVPVVSHLPGVTDNLVSDGENGYLVPVGDVNSMVKQIMLLLGNRETLELMKCKSMETAKSRFSVGRMTEHYLRMIDPLSNR